MNKISLLILSILLQMNTSKAQYEINKVKAEVFERFIRFVSWPEAGSDTTHFEIVIYGESDLGNYLKDNYTGKTKFLKNKPVIIHSVEHISEIKSPDLLYIASSAIDELSMIKESLKDAPVLTVTDFPQACEKGIMVNLSIENKKIKIEINLEESKKVGLKVDALLLNYATLISTK